MYIWQVMSFSFQQKLSLYYTENPNFPVSFFVFVKIKLYQYHYSLQNWPWHFVIAEAFAERNLLFL